MECIMPRRRKAGVGRRSAIPDPGRSKNERRPIGSIDRRMDITVRRAGHHGTSAVCGRACRSSAIRSRSFFLDRKSTRLNSSHVKISYAVFCLKKKKKKQKKKYKKKKYITIR